MKIPQIITGIEGKPIEFIIRQTPANSISFSALDSPFDLSSISSKNNDSLVSLTNPIQGGNTYYYIEIKVNDISFMIPIRVFRKKEFFLTFVLQGNEHVGWNPRVMAPFYDELNGGNSLRYRKEKGLQSDLARGHAFSHHFGDHEEMQKYDSQFHYYPLEKMIHEHGFPISWLIDGVVANEYSSKLTELIKKNNDSIGYLPSSYFYQNNINYNLQRTIDETQNLMENTIKSVESAFAPILPIYSTYCGIDQWVGSIGTNWINAAESLGLEGIWGMGWDHLSCDTSMYHRGAPWNAYKPDKDQFRCVMTPGSSRKIWAFQWTIRDLVNTLPLSPHGSVCFSTDLDDIRSQGILQNERNPTYFLKLLKTYLKNYESLESFVFLIHQEDHDAHFRENNEFMQLFLNELKTEISNGIPVTVATLQEIVAWLNLKYAPEESNMQLIELEDPLSISTRGKIQHKYFDTIARIYDPDEEEEIQELLDAEFPADKNANNILAFFDNTSLWITRYPDNVPKQMFDYLDDIQKSIEENGELMMVNLPLLRDIKINQESSQISISFRSEQSFNSLPFVIWTEDKMILERATRSTRSGAIFYLNVKSGENSFIF